MIFYELMKDKLKRETSPFGFKNIRKSLTKRNDQVGKTNISRDKKRKAMPPGKRISKTGKIYYEGRKNRSDLSGTNI